MGRGKQKGATFERKMCRELSLWATDGERADVFWRSAMSGGRATLGAQRKDGVKYDKQVGDISAVSREGHVLLDLFAVEVKHYRMLHMERWIFGVPGLADILWRKPYEEARAAEREPFIILKQNQKPEVVLVTEEVAEWFGTWFGVETRATFPWLGIDGWCPHLLMLTEVLEDVDYHRLPELAKELK